MERVKYVNLVMRFLLELCALVVLGYWGFQAGNGYLAKVGLAIAVPLLTAIAWGAFVAPRAIVPVSGFLRLLLELIFFGSAAAALYAVGQTTLAVIFGILVLVNLILVHAWKQ